MAANWPEVALAVVAVLRIELELRRMRADTTAVRQAVDRTTVMVRAGDDSRTALTALDQRTEPHDDRPPSPPGPPLRAA